MPLLFDQFNAFLQNKVLEYFKNIYKLYFNSGALNMLHQLDCKIS